MEEIVFSVSDFVAVLNQTLEYAYPSVTIVGELANFRVSKNRWVYFDLKDENASVKFFGTTYQLSGPLEDGLLMQVRGVPRLHQLYGFSVNVQFMSPLGEGSIKKASELLQAKLSAEGLFDPSRKRSIAYPPNSVGLITSGESAAYHDFIKIMNERWGGVEVQHADVQVQGEAAINQIVNAINYFNTHANPVDVLVVTRGGGSAEDLATFSTEQVTRAVAGSRIPTLVAIGHEVDLSLAELAADKRASTPSNAAQLLFPDKSAILSDYEALRKQLLQAVTNQIVNSRQKIIKMVEIINESLRQQNLAAISSLKLKKQVLAALNPASVLKRGYAVVRHNGQVVRTIGQLGKGSVVSVQMIDGTAQATVTKLQ